MAAFASGERAKNSTRLWGWRERAFSRSNSSAGRITTASLPWRVTHCGPSERARRNTSLNYALAVWSCQRVLDTGFAAARRFEGVLLAFIRLPRFRLV